MTQFLGKFIIITGIVLVLIGTALLFGDKIPFLGKLPGDIYMRGKTGGFYFPVVSCIVVSVVLTVIFNVFLRK